MYRNRKPRTDSDRDRERDKKDKERGRGRERERDRDGEDRERERERGRPSKDPTRDQYKRHLEKLMEHPEKPVIIPEKTKERKPKEPPEFVRFYMGSSAGAGSEVFHVYRHLRRRENDRQNFISQKAEEEELELEFQQKLAANKAEADARTAKKRAKRLKRKQRQKLKKKQAKTVDKQGGSTSGEENQNDSSGQGSEGEEEPHFVIGGT